MNTVWFVVTRLGRDRSALIGLVLIALLVLAALLAPMLATHPDDVFELHPSERLRAPSGTHCLGTERMGAAFYSRLLFGARITILIGLIAVGASLIIGVPIGLVAGHHHGWASEMLMRVSDIFLAVPQVVLAIAIAQTLGPSLPNVILALSVTYWPWFARVVYAATRALQKEVFVESTTALGVSPWRLTVLHVLPNIASPSIVRASIVMGFTILTAASLGFLGLGPPPPTPEWGRTIAESREFLPDAWWYAAAPGLAIFLTVLGFNLLGDRLRDVLDPRLRRRAAAGAPVSTRGCASARRPRRAELLAVRGLRVDFATDRGPAQVLDGINLDIAAGEVVGLVGESGCGKTTLARAILGVLPEGAARIRGGEVRFRGTDLLKQDSAVVNERVRGSAIDFSRQDPFR